jgi:hypothetical protein
VRERALTGGGEGGLAALFDVIEVEEHRDEAVPAARGGGWGEQAVVGEQQVSSVTQGTDFLPGSAGRPHAGPRVTRHGVAERGDHARSGATMRRPCVAMRHGEGRTSILVGQRHAGAVPLPCSGRATTGAAPLPRLCRASVAPLPRLCRASAAPLPRLCRASAAPLPRLCIVAGPLQRPLCPRPTKKRDIRRGAAYTGAPRRPHTPVRRVVPPRTKRGMAVCSGGATTGQGQGKGQGRDRAVCLVGGGGHDKDRAGIGEGTGAGMDRGGPGHTGREGLGGRDHREELGGREGLRGWRWWGGAWGVGGGWWCRALVVLLPGSGSGHKVGPLPWATPLGEGRGAIQGATQGASRGASRGTTQGATRSHGVLHGALHGRQHRPSVPTKPEWWTGSK